MGVNWVSLIPFVLRPATYSFQYSNQERSNDQTQSVLDDLYHTHAPCTRPTVQANKENNKRPNQNMKRCWRVNCSWVQVRFGSAWYCLNKLDDWRKQRRKRLNKCIDAPGRVNFHIFGIDLCCISLRRELLRPTVRREECQWPSFLWGEGSTHSCEQVH